MGPLEDRFRAQIETTSAAVGAVDADGTPISAIVEVPGQGRISVHAGLLERLDDEFRYESEGGKRIRWFRAPLDVDAHARKIAYQLHADKQTVESFDSGAVELVFEPLPAPRLIELPDARFVVDETSHRVFGKFLISTLACFDGDAARSSFLGDFRRYVRTGGVSRFQPDIHCLGSGLITEEEAPHLAHGAEVWSANGALFGMVRFFGLARFTTRLGPWSRAPVAVAYVFDPLSPRQDIGRSKASDGPAPVIFGGNGDGDVMSARFIERIEAAITRAKSFPRPKPVPPTLETLRPLIRRYLGDMTNRARR